MVLYWLFLIALVIQLAFAMFFFSRIYLLKQAQPLAAVDRNPVSIIICAKDESANLAKNLPAILAQNYADSAGQPRFEVIVVNDGSTDDSLSILRSLPVKVVNIAADEPRNLPGKKCALSRGLAAASHDWLLLTDADCMPSGPEWIAHMVAPLAHGKEIVAGYGGYYATAGWLNAFIRWETVHTFLQFSTFSVAGFPYMAVGRNMACTKNVLLNAQQSPLWGRLPSGDDDLLVRLQGTKQNVAIVCSPQAFTHSPSKSTLPEWVAQKQRHLSTGKYYKLYIKVLLGLYGLSHAVLWLSCLLLLLTGSGHYVALFLLLRCLLYWELVAKAYSKTGEKIDYIYLLLSDIGWMVYNFAFLPYITWKNKKSWK